jgi:TolA-binding protein
MNRTLRSVTDCPENLSVLSRRAGLSAADQRRFELALASSEGLRCLHELGTNFDGLETSLSQDEMLLRRIALRARQRSRGGHDGWHLRRVAAWYAGLAALLGSLGAVAGFWGARALGPSAPTEVAALPESATPVPQHRAGSTSALVASAASPAPSGVAAPTERRVASVDPSGEPPGPGELFRSANRARKQADPARAIEIYHQLEAQYPDSPEALLSHVLIGRMQLGRGENEGALRHFSVYLDTARAGPLAEEAMQGKAEALHRLRRFGEERAVWTELLRAFPNSIYAASGRERLGEGNH